MFRKLMLIAILLLVPLFGFVAFLTIMQTRLILPANVNTTENPAPGTYQTLSIATPDGATLHGILFPAKTTSNTTLILAFPGNAHNPVGFATFLHTQVFPENNIAIAALSYRGYPNGLTPPSTGTPSQAAMYADSLLIYDTLTAQLKPTQVKVVGYSIGTAVSTYLGIHRKVAAMALVAPIASVRRIAQEKYPWLPIRLLLRHPFAVEDMIGRLKTAATLIYSPTDGLVPVAHVTTILHNANPAIPQIAVPNTDHVSLVLAPELPNLLRTALATE